ncbi:MAG: transcriptional regulator [Symbiopectobacterium sp.]|uniref:transcriptional regulator n=1 Tax=Symbiopectobacterium sp. TaxID=2952789 RepID=UPI0039E98F5B
MNDRIHEDNYLPRMLTNVLDQPPDPYLIKGLDSRYIYANLGLAKLVGVRSLNDVLHKTEFEFNSRLTEDENVVKEWLYQDSLVGTTRKKLSMLEIHPGAVSYPYIVRKLPFYDDNNQFVGVITYGKTLETFTPSDFINGRCPGSLLLHKPDDFFTERECEIIFLKLQGRTCKNIGDMLFCRQEQSRAHCKDFTLRPEYLISMIFLNSVIIKIFIAISLGDFLNVNARCSKIITT